jgi:hypothetical protein
VRVFIVNYGMGNLRSVYNAVKHVGGEPVIVNNPEELEGEDNRPWSWGLWKGDEELGTLLTKNPPNR